MSERVWHRSLYWRIGLGIIVLLVVLLVVQAGVLVWLLTRSPAEVAPRLLNRAARFVADELGAALERDAALDLQDFVNDRDHALGRPVILVMADGRVVSGRGVSPPPWVLSWARIQLQRRTESGRPTRLAGMAPVLAGGQRAGLVVVLAGRAPRALLREFGPPFAAVALVLAVGGTALAALLVFGPAHRRLRDLERAAERLGAGEVSARAGTGGGDEIAAVSEAFNRMADELTRRMAQVESSDRARRQLLADVSHELMTPLTAMRGYLETLRMPEVQLDDETRRGYVGVVLEETLRLERIIGDLLDLARLDAGAPVLDVRQVRIADVFERVRLRHDPALRSKGVTLAVQHEAVGVIEADPDRLEQALQNLVANALRHTPEGGRIALNAGTEADEVVLSVHDTGEGIPTEHLPHVFERFYKADASRAGAPGSAGSGLGLSIVKAIVEQHGGRVSARSRSGADTVFEIRLPRRPGACKAPAV